MGKSIGNSNYNGMVVTGKYQGRKGTFLQGLLHGGQID